jgi:hypothetical protein
LINYFEERDGFESLEGFADIFFVYIHPIPRFYLGVCCKEIIAPLFVVQRFVTFYMTYNNIQRNILQIPSILIINSNPFIPECTSRAIGFWNNKDDKHKHCTNIPAVLQEEKVKIIGRKFWTNFKE